jgi:hypothetical protein
MLTMRSGYPHPSMSRDFSEIGEREFAPRRTGPLFRWVKRVSIIELAVFAGLLFFWLTPGFDRETFWFGLAHGIGFLILCAVMWVAVLRREAPFWLLAATVTPLGPIGSTIGILAIEHREARAPRAPLSAEGRETSL